MTQILCDFCGSKMDADNEEIQGKAYIKRSLRGDWINVGTTVHAQSPELASHVCLECKASAIQETITRFLPPQQQSQTTEEQA